MIEYEKARALYEHYRKPVSDVVWCGNGYAPTSYNAWDANDYCEQFRGFLILFLAIRNDQVDPYLMELKDEDSE